MTPLEPAMVASQVVQEACNHLEMDLENTAALEAHLIKYATEISQASGPFRKHLRSAAARDWLYAFMRHWLAAELKRTHPQLYHKFPQAFTMGRGLELGHGVH
jgi:hypothetical protein